MIDSTFKEMMIWRGQLKGNYAKGVHFLRTMLSNEETRKLALADKALVRLILDADVNYPDGNSEVLRDLLLEADTEGSAVQIFLEAQYGKESLDAFFADEETFTAGVSDPNTYDILLRDTVGSAKLLAKRAGLETQDYMNCADLLADSAVLTKIFANGNYIKEAMASFAFVQAMWQDEAAYKRVLAASQNSFNNIVTNTYVMESFAAGCLSRMIKSSKRLKTANEVFTSENFELLRKNIACARMLCCLDVFQSSLTAEKLELLLGDSADATVRTQLAKEGFVAYRVCTKKYDKLYDLGSYSNPFYDQLTDAEALLTLKNVYYATMQKYETLDALYAADNNDFVNTANEYGRIGVMLSCKSLRDKLFADETMLTKLINGYGNARIGLLNIAGYDVARSALVLNVCIKNQKGSFNDYMRTEKHYNAIESTMRGIRSLFRAVKPSGSTIENLTRSDNYLNATATTAGNTTASKADNSLVYIESARGGSSGWCYLYKLEDDEKLYSVNSTSREYFYKWIAGGLKYENMSLENVKIYEAI